MKSTYLRRLARRVRVSAVRHKKEERHADTPKVEGYNPRTGATSHEGSNHTCFWRDDCNG